MELDDEHERVREMLPARTTRASTRFRIIIVVDAFQSETVGFADLVFPDTTYLERYDSISLLDRPISEPDGPADAIRQPILPLDRDVRPWQDVLVEIASRLKFPAFTREDGSRKFRDYKDFIVNYESCRASAFSPDGAARMESRRCAVSRTRSSGKSTSRTSRSSPTRCRRRCVTTATRTRTTSNSRKSTRCSARRRCR